MPRVRDESAFANLQAIEGFDGQLRAFSAIENPTSAEKKKFIISIIRSNIKHQKKDLQSKVSATNSERLITLLNTIISQIEESLSNPSIQDKDLYKLITTFYLTCEASLVDEVNQERKRRQALRPDAKLELQGVGQDDYTPYSLGIAFGCISNLSAKAFQKLADLNDAANDFPRVNPEDEPIPFATLALYSVFLEIKKLPMVVLNIINSALPGFEQEISDILPDIIETEQVPDELIMADLSALIEINEKGDFDSEDLKINMKRMILNSIHAIKNWEYRLSQIKEFANDSTLSLSLPELVDEIQAVPFPDSLTEEARIIKCKVLLSLEQKNEAEKNLVQSLILREINHLSLKEKIDFLNVIGKRISDEKTEANVILTKNIFALFLKTCESSPPNELSTAFEWLTNGLASEIITKKFNTNLKGIVEGTITLQYEPPYSLICFYKEALEYNNSKLREALALPQGARQEIIYKLRKLKQITEFNKNLTSHYFKHVNQECKDIFQELLACESPAVPLGNLSLLQEVSEICSEYQAAVPLDSINLLRKIDLFSSFVTKDAKSRAIQRHLIREVVEEAKKLSKAEHKKFTDELNTKRGKHGTHLANIMPMPRNKAMFRLGIGLGALMFAAGLALSFIIPPVGIGLAVTSVFMPKLFAHIHELRLSRQDRQVAASYNIAKKVKTVPVTRVSSTQAKQNARNYAKIFTGCALVLGAALVVGLCFAFPPVLAVLPMYAGAGAIAGAAAAGLLAVTAVSAVIAESATRWLSKRHNPVTSSSPVASNNSRYSNIENDAATEHLLSEADREDLEAGAGALASNPAAAVSSRPVSAMGAGAGAGARTSASNPGVAVSSRPVSTTGAGAGAGAGTSASNPGIAVSSRPVSTTGAGAGAGAGTSALNPAAVVSSRPVSAMGAGAGTVSTPFMEAAVARPALSCDSSEALAVTSRRDREPGLFNLLSPTGNYVVTHDISAISDAESTRRVSQGSDGSNPFASSGAAEFERSSTALVR